MSIRSRPSLYGFLELIRSALNHFNDSDGFAMASHVALSIMLAVFPFLIFTASLAGFLSDEAMLQQIEGLVFDYWPDQIAEPIVREVDAVLSQGSAGFLTLGIAIALVFASNGIEAIRVALNRAYGEETTSQSFWRQRLQSFVFVFVCALMIISISLLLVVAPIYLSIISDGSPRIFERLLQIQALRASSASALLVFLVFACHHWLPVRTRSIASILPGIAFTLVCWVVIGGLFTLYVQRLATYNATYAGLAGVMTALVFLYLMAALFIFGAEYNAAVERSPRRGRDALASSKAE